MKHVKRIIAVIVCCLLCSPAPVSAMDYGKTEYDGTRWDDIMEDYLDAETDRLIFVRCEGGTEATVEMWKKVSAEAKSFTDEAVKDEAMEETETVTEWEKTVSCRGYTGLNGLDKKREGDCKTPVGIFNITMAFGRKKSPGTAGISYTKLNRYHYWSGEKDTYNQFVDVRDLNRSKMSGEHLISYDPWYNYALALDYNRECRYKKGSAIFLHCIGGGRTWTMGCIAVSENNMKKIVQNTTGHTKICIYPSGEKISLKKNSGEKTAFEKMRPTGVMATAVNDRIAVSFEPVAGAETYEIYEAEGDDSRYRLIRTTADCQAVLEEKEAGATFSYYIRACKKTGNGKVIYSKKSTEAVTTVADAATSTIKNFLTTALAPVGSTMYVWGGGWNEEDTGAGPEAVRIGLSPSWRSFAEGKDASYNYREHRYKIHMGLDCSGYVGWAVYNVLNTENEGDGYVCSASKQARTFSELGFGSYRSAEEIKNYKAGDIMSSSCKCCGHVWIVVGQCGDGSVVLLHSSPSGVQLNGTVTPQGKKNSQAVALAKKYMKKYYGEWYRKYPGVDKGAAYLSHYGQMRWKTTGKKAVLSDPDGYQDMGAKEVLEDLFDRR